MHPQHEEWVRQFRRIGEVAQALAEGVDEAAWRNRPAEGRWSAGECVEHLGRTARLYQPLMDDALERGPRGGTPPFRYGAPMKLAIRFMEPPPRARVAAPGRFRPLEVPPKEEGIQEFHRLQDEFVRLVLKAEGRDLSRIRIASPIARFLRMNLAAAFAFLAAHERRHLWQAGRARRSTSGNPTISTSPGGLA